MMLCNLYKTDDPKYTIYALSGMIDYRNNIKKILTNTEKDIIEKVLKNLFIGLSKTGLINKKHTADSSGKSYGLSDYKFHLTIYIEL